MQIASGQISPYKETVVVGAKFQVVLSNTDTIFMSTRDTVFKTPEGFGVGTAFGSLPKYLKEKLSEESGFAYRINLKSGWILGFCEGSSCTTSMPADSSIVDIVFKRK